VLYRYCTTSPPGELLKNNHQRKLEEKRSKTALHWQQPEAAALKSGEKAATTTGWSMGWETWDWVSISPVGRGIPRILKKNIFFVNEI